MKWKNKLKAILTEAKKTEKTEMGLEKPLPKTDETNPTVVSSVFGSGQLPSLPKNLWKIESESNCSVCGLELEMWQNKPFCSMGCVQIQQV